MDNNPPRSLFFGLPAWVFLAARLFVGTVLFVSGLFKILAPTEEFAAALGVYQMVPNGLIEPVATYLPWIEYTLGGFLLLGFLTPASSLAACGIFAVFLSLLTVTRLQGIAVDNCGCFGPIGPRLTLKQVSLLDAVCLWLSLVIFLNKKQIFSLDRWLEK